MYERLRVVKLGGSLFELPDLAERVERWLALQPSCVTVVVPGGGKLADAVRTLDELHALGETAAHWLCVEAMGVTAQLVHRLLPTSLLAATCDEIAASVSPDRLYALDVRGMLQTDARSPNPLPIGWQVTSDSIAARAAGILSASELTLLKSTLPLSDELCHWSSSGFVDAYFAVAASGLPRVRCVNMLDGAFREICAARSASDEP